MSQAPNFGVNTAGPSSMAAYAARDIDSLMALLTLHSGAARPSYAQAQTPWLKVVSATQWELYLYTGSSDILIGTFDPTGGTFVGNSAILGFDTSAVARNDVTPLSLINGRSSFSVGSNGEGILRLLGRSSGNGDEAAIRWANGVTDTMTFEMLAEQTTSLRLRDGSSVEFLKFLATGDIESKLWAKLSEQLVPKGAIVFGAWTSAPPGFVVANGALVSRTTYAALWAAVSTRGKLVTEAAWSGGMFGAFSNGDTSTTFRLPLINTDFIRGLYQEAGGRLVGLWETSGNLSHVHAITDPGHLHRTFGVAVQNSNSAAAGATAHGAVSTDLNTDSRTTGISINSSGDSEARPRNVSMLACVKV